jgi:4-carboxymuconolactone decarboxylase
MLSVTLAAAPAVRAADRFPVLYPDQMTPEQKKVAVAIQSGPRASLGGPFNTWLRSPETADRLQRVGEQLRFHSSVPSRLNEFAILITARAWDADYEWSAHYPLAMKAGLKPQVAADLAQGRRPRGMAGDEAAVYDFTTELRRTHRVSDRTFATAKGVLGDQGVVDLIALSGYYDLVSMTLDVAEVAAPADGPRLPPRQLPPRRRTKIKKSGPTGGETSGKGPSRRDVP